MKFKVINRDFAVCKVSDYSNEILNADYCFTAKTDEEVSLVCPIDYVPVNTTSRDDGWCAFRVEGVLDFSLIGILAKISAVLAENKIGIFAVSTYNTDYIFTKKENFSKALLALEAVGYEIIQ